MFTRGINPRSGYAVVLKSNLYKNMQGSVIFLNGQRLFPIASSFIEFLTTYISDLEAGVYQVEKFIPDYEHRLISQYPSSGPSKTYSNGPITNGVQIRISSVPHLMEHAPRQLSYSYQVTLLFHPHESVYQQVELISRHWQIQYSSNHLEHVNGPGVIGLYPILNEQNTKFTYSSICTEMVRARPIWMEGALKFKSNNGVEFLVPLARIEFQVPL